ncbi:MAG: TatD family hydrolase [Halothiobacillaceae bacterium]
MPLYDSHCHLADARLVGHRAAVLARAHAVGVDALLGVAAQSRDWPVLLRLAHAYPGVGVALGLHPWFEHPPAALARLAVWVERGGAIAVGECGLDFSPGRPLREVQEQWLLPQLRIARERDLPVILHAHRSEDVLAMHIARLPGLRGVVHGFHGSRQQAERFLALGFYLGIGGAITHPRATRLRAVVAALPKECLLVESDAPDQPPHGRTMPNEPAFIIDTLQVLARLHGTTPAAMAAITWQNAASLFRFPKANRDR